MKDFLEAIQFLFACSIFVAGFGFAAFLIYKQVDGWGWYLFFVFLILGSLNIKVGQ